MRVLLAPLCAVLLAAGCSGGTPPPNRVVVGLETGPLTLDPRFATDATAAQIGDLMFDGLTRLDAGSQRQPHLAASWDTPDPRTYIFHLREGFRFPDGQTLTAADVKATYDSVLDAATRSPKRQALDPIAEVEAIDPLTVRFRLREPFAPFLDASGLGIVAQRQITASPTKPLARPQGSGAYRLEELRLDEHVLLRRNPTYPLGPAHIEQIDFKVVPDAVTRLLELRRGTLDLVQNGVDPDALDWLRRQPGVTILTGPSTTFQYLGMNLRDPKLHDVRVRYAIAAAIDRQAIIATILKGLAVPATGLLPPAHWAYEAHVPSHTYNPERAKRWLDRAGYPDPDGDGPAPRFRLTYKTTTIELRRRIAEVLQEQLARVGIALDIRSYDWATFYDDIKRGNFQLYSLAWVGVEDPDLYYLAYHSSQTPPLGNNRGACDDAQIDRLTTAARYTLDSGTRRGLYADVQRRASALLPVIPLWWPTNVAAINRRLQGFAVQPNTSYASLKDAQLDAEQ